MIDVITDFDTPTFSDTQMYQAKNIILTQLGSIYYDKNIGIDLAYFLDPAFKFQNEAFYNYVSDRLTNAGIVISKITNNLIDFIGEYIIELPSPNNETAINN